MGPATLIVFLNTNIPDNVDFNKLLAQLGAIFTYIWVLPAKQFRRQACLRTMSQQNTNNDKKSNNFCARIKRICPQIKHYSCGLILHRSEKQQQHHKIEYLRYFVDFWSSDLSNLEKIQPALMRMKNNFERRDGEGMMQPVKIIVFDLDETLIDCDRKPLIVGLHAFLTAIKNSFNFIVLWSHGTASHVNTSLRHNKLAGIFDLVICRENDEETDNKGLGFVLRSLNQKFGVQSIHTSVLVDDLVDNYIGDYDFFLNVPTEPENIADFYNKAFPLLQKFMFEGRQQEVISLNSIKGS